MNRKEIPQFRHGFSRRQIKFRTMGAGFVQRSAEFVINGIQVALQRDDMTRLPQAFGALTLLLVTFVSPAAAQYPAEWLCDTQYQDCREPILNLIRNESVGIDVGFWYMEDDRYVYELIERHRRGVPIRVLVDQRGNKYRLNETMLNRLRDAGIPMRDKFGGDVLHWKMMLFHGQNRVQFSKANYNAWALAPQVPNVSYDDEAVYFTNDNRITDSFRARFDERWVNTTLFRNYANISTTAPLTPTYSGVSVHSSMNFPPDQDFSVRSVSRYNAETRAIDAIVFRVTDHSQANGMINAVARGVPVRLITEPTEYRNRTRVWDAKHKDRMHMGGVQMKFRRLQSGGGGIMHQASVVMHGLGEVIFGSSNWTSASAIYSDEHNFFYNPGLNKPWFFQWFADQFDRKWEDTANYEPFRPLPPDTPLYFSPANAATGQGSSVTLSFDGQEFAHYYDIYFGTTVNPPLVLSQEISDSTEQLGSPLTGQRESFTVTNLLPGTTYYWRVVGKTWANQVASGPTWSFTTSGTAPGGGTPPPTGGSTPYGGSAVGVPGTFEAENFDLGGQNVAYYDTAVGNSGGAYRSEDVDIQSTSDVSGLFNVGWTKAGEWLQYTVNVGASASYRIEARVANSGAGGRFHVNVDGVDRTGAVTVPNTGGWQSWQTISSVAIPLNAGQRVIRVVFDAVSSTGSVANINWFRIVPADGSTPTTPPPTPTSPAYGGTPTALAGVLQAEHFDVGAQGVAYYDASAGNSGGVFRTDTNVDIGADPATGDFFVGWARVGEWLRYTVNVTESRTYRVGARLANLGSGATFRVEVDGVDRTGAITVPNTGGWDAWQNVNLGNIVLTQGSHVIRVVMLTRNVENSSVGNFDYFAFE